MIESLMELQLIGNSTVFPSDMSRRTAVKKVHSRGELRLYRGNE